MTEFASNNAKKQLAIARASALAQESKIRFSANDATEFVKVTKDKLQFQIAELQAKYKLICDLAVLTDQEKLQTLFFLLDVDNDGEISAVELADGLRKIKGNVGFKESIREAIKKVAEFRSDRDARLSLAEFETFINEFSSEIGATFHEISEMLVMTVVFSKSGNTQEENEQAQRSSIQIDEAVVESVEVTEEEYYHENTKTRMHALFNLFDSDANGTVEFKEVVVGMYRITKGVDGASKAAVNALLMFDMDNSRSLDFEQFSRFIINVVAAVPEVSFEDIADLITKSASGDVDEEYSSEVIAEMFSLDSNMKHVMDLSAATQEEVDQLKGVELGRVNRLFDLWDTDSDGKIDYHELALGMRKFEETTDLKQSVEESIKVMNDFDTDGDQTLDRNEFACFVTRFAYQLEADFHEMVDFMIVTSAMKENSETERRYIKSIGASDVYYWGW